MYALAYAGFSKGEQENLRILKTKRKISPLKISPFSCPKLGENQKKKKKKVFSQSLYAFVLKLSAQATKGRGRRHAATFHTILC